MGHVSGFDPRLSTEGCRTRCCLELHESILMVHSLSLSLSGQVDAVHWSVHGQCDLQFFSLHDESGIPLMFVDWVRQVKAQLTGTTNIHRYMYIYIYIVNTGKSKIL